MEIEEFYRRFYAEKVIKFEPYRWSQIQPNIRRIKCSKEPDTDVVLVQQFCSGGDIYTLSLVKSGNDYTFEVDIDDDEVFREFPMTVETYYKQWFKEFDITTNPLGDWTGGINVDSGATNRKLGSDMAQSVTGGGLHGKDLSKADVSVNIYAFLKAQETGKPVELCCAIGDKEIDGKSYSEIVDIARKYIKEIGGFEKFAEWGLF